MGQIDYIFDIEDSYVFVQKSNLFYLSSYKSDIIYQKNLKMLPEISQFANSVNHPLCEYMDSIPFHKANPQEQKLYFLSGDATAYGNNSFRMPEEGYEIVRKYISNPDNHGYTMTPGVPSARQAILKLYKPKFPVTPNHVNIQHGVNQGLLVALMSFTNKGDEILVPQIGYPIFEKLAPALGVKVVHYKLKAESNYEIDLQNLQTLTTQKTQFLFIINPSNPMGTIFSLEHMQNIIKFCDKHQLPIVSDQVYHGEAFQNHQFHSFGDVTEHVPVLVLSGVEKILSVPGWSTSWSVLFDKHNYLQNIWKNISTCGMIFLHTNKFTQLALPELLEKVGLFTQKPIHAVKKIHDELYEQFKKIKGFKPIRAQGTFYMTILIDPDCFNGIKNDKQFAQKLLEQQNIAILPLSIFGGSSNGFRMLTCAKTEIYKEFLDRIKSFNERHRKEQK